MEKGVVVWEWRAWKFEAWRNQRAQSKSGECFSGRGVKRVREIGTLVWISRNHYLLLIASPIELQ